MRDVDIVRLTVLAVRTFPLRPLLRTLIDVVKRLLAHLRGSESDPLSSTAADIRALMRETLAFVVERLAQRDSIVPLQDEVLVRLCSPFYFNNHPKRLFVLRRCNTGSARATPASRLFDC